MILFFASVTFLLSTDNAPPLKPVSLQLQWLHQFQFAGFYIAKEKGFYKDVGLDVDIREFTAETNTIDDVVAGRADFGIGRSIIIDGINRKKVVALGAMFQHSPLMLLTTKESGIDSAKALKGKRLMFKTEDVTSAPIIAMIASAGLSMDDIAVQPHSFNIQDLIDGKTDAMLSYTTNEPFMLEERGIDYHIISPSDYGFDFYSDILFTSRKLLQNHPDTVRNFYDASIKGWLYAFEHMEESVDLILAKYNTQKKSRAHLLFEAKALKQLAFADEVPYGHIDRAKIRRIIDIYKVLQLCDDHYSAEGLIYQFKKQDAVPDFTEAEKRWLADHPVLRVGIDIAWPPFEYVDDDGGYRGMAAEYMALLESRLGIKLQVEKRLDWAQTVDAMKNRRLDLYSCVVKTPERSRYMDFTSPYLSFPMVIITHDKIRYIKGLHELDGKKVAVVKGYVTHEILENYYPDIGLVTTKNVEEALDMVSYDQVDAFVGNIATASYYIKKGGYTNVKVAGQTPYRFELALAGRKDWPLLTSVIQKALDSITQEERDAIYNRWISISYEHGFDYTLMWKILGGIALLFILIIIWNRTLAKEITKRKNAEKQLRELNQNLEEEVARKLGEIREKDKMLMRQSQMAVMGEMIGVIAHQLKQPLNSIGLLVQDSLDAYEYNELDKVYMKNFVERTMDQIDFMALTIDDFRNFFNPNKKKKEFETKMVIEKIIALMSVQYAKADITLGLDLEACPVFGTPGELQQIILNIANNAKEALEKGETKERRITIASRCEGETFVLTIEDNAGGIPETVIDHVFDPYYTTKGEKGTGLGLYMVKMIVETDFSGTVAVRNGEEGACFTVTLPFSL